MSSPPTSAAPRVRLYYALWPERAVAERMHEHAVVLQAAVGGRITRVDSIHLTLAFLGNVGAFRLEELRAPPAAIAVEPFRVDIDRVGAWHHNGVGWVAPSVTPPPLAELQSRLSEWLESIGFTLERRAFAPHATILRKCTGKVATASIETIRWAVDAYVLVQSTPDLEGSRYEVIGRFSLAGRPSP
jgi:RNA 2',3'-cyclic 3'-phosphodiesterase